MGWRNTKVEDIREYLVKSYLAGRDTMANLCEECGVSRKTGYKWVKRFQSEGLHGLSDISKAPKKPSRKYAETQITKVLELKHKHPSFGPKKIHALLKRFYSDESWPGVTRIYEILKEHHLVCSRKLKRRVPRTQPLGVINESNDIWCADFKGWFLTEDKSKVEPFTITDAYSRFIIECIHLERKRFEDVWKVLARCFHEYGLPKRIRTDNGPPFASRGVGRLCKLSVYLIKAGVTPEWINPGCPQENGRHERFHKSLKHAIASPPAQTFREQISRMKCFVSEYNFERPHEALDMHTPIDYYQPSNRAWDGVLRPPEYNSSELIVRKVCSNGCIHMKRNSIYLGGVISGEYVGLEQVDEDYYKIYYGPIFLGTLMDNKDFKRPEMLKRKPRSNVTYVSEQCNLTI